MALWIRGRDGHFASIEQFTSNIIFLEVKFWNLEDTETELIDIESNSIRKQNVYQLRNDLETVKLIDLA